MSLHVLTYRLDPGLFQKLGLLHRGEIQVTAFAEPSALCDAALRLKPVAVLAQLRDEQLSELLTAWRRSTLKNPMLLVSEKPESRMALEWIINTPGAQVIAGGGRFEARVVEALSTVLDLHPRRYARTAVFEAAVGIVSAAKKRTDAQVKDWSPNGVRVEGELTLAVGEKCQLLFPVTGDGLQVEAIVRRRIVSDSPRPSYGLEFTSMSAADERTLTDHLLAKSATPTRFDPPRKHPRLTIPQGMGLTASIGDEGERMEGLEISNLSLGGFLAITKSSTSSFPVGSVLRAELSWGANRLRTWVVLMRDLPGAKEDRALAFRFVELSSEGTQRISELLGGFDAMVKVAKG